MILNINDLSKFYGDLEVKFIKTIIRTKDDTVGILPSNKMGSLMDLITSGLIPENVQKIYILGHFLDEVTLEELELFVNHLCNNRNNKPYDFEVLINYNTDREIENKLYEMGISIKKIYYHLNIKELDMIFTHEDRSSFSATLTISNCKKKFEYKMVNYAFHHNNLTIIGRI